MEQQLTPNPAVQQAREILVDQVNKADCGRTFAYAAGPLACDDVAAHDGGCL